ncbi:MAG: hypothetical protein ACJ8HJ_30375 [Massilia sp.]
MQGAAEQQAWSHARKTGASQGPGGMPGYSYFTNEDIVALQVYLTEQARKRYEAQSVCKTKQNKTKQNKTKQNRTKWHRNFQHEYST